MKLKNKITTSLTALTLLTAYNSANAGVKVGAGFGFLGGFNVNAGYRFSGSSNSFLQRIAVRGDFNIISVKGDSNTTGELDYDSKFATYESTAMGVLVDIHPFNNMFLVGGLRLTGGYYFNSEAEITVTATGSSTQEVTIGDETVTLDASDEWISINGDWDLSGIYGGLGWDIGVFRGLKISLDLGAIMTDSPKISINSNISIPQDDIDKEIEEREETISDLDFYPMFKMGVSYQF